MLDVERIDNGMSNKEGTFKWVYATHFILGLAFKAGYVSFFPLFSFPFTHTIWNLR